MDRYFVKKDVYDEIIKAMRDRSHLTQKKITDKNGHQRTVWVRPGEEPAAIRTKKEEEPTEQKTAKPKYETGSTVNLNGLKGDFKITSVDKDGTYHVVSADGKKGYKVSENNIARNVENDSKQSNADKKEIESEKKNDLSKEDKIEIYSNYMHKKFSGVSVEKWKEACKKLTDDELNQRFSEYAETHSNAIKDYKNSKNEGQKKQLTPTYGRKQIPADKFIAADYKKTYDDDTIDTTYEGIEEALRQAQELPIVKRHPEFMFKLRADLQKAENEPETVEKYRKSGEGAEAVYTPERTAIHKKIIDRLIQDKLDAAKPKDGESPTFQILGGRGGSGKSTFNKKKSDAGVYHSDNVIVVDPDALKQELANESGDGWEGWKAKAYHEESSDVSKMLMKKAMALGLNIVMDITMSNADKQIDELKMAKKLGYKTGAYYMHVPKQESFKRAMKRYIESEETEGVEDFSGRLVPPDVLLGMTENESNFDKVKEFADDWSFYDNFIPYEKDPKTNKNKYKAEKIAQKGE